MVISNKNFIVYRSSAGSGKTYTLVKEYLRLALRYDNASYYKKILAITFTNAAASEMKERVVKQLKAFSINDEKSEEMMASICEELDITRDVLNQRAKDTLVHILHHFSEFSISTIDSFVHSIIRTFARELKLHPDFEIELDSEKVLSRAIDDLFSQIGHDAYVTDIMQQYAEQQIEDEKSWDVKDSLLQMSKVILDEKGKVVLEKLAALEPSDFTTILKNLKGELDRFSNRIIELGESGLALIEKNGIEHASFSSGYIPKYFEKLKRFNRLEKTSGDISSPSASIQNMASGEKSFYSQKTSPSQKESIDSIDSELKGILNEIFELLFGEEGIWHNTRILIYKSFFSNALIKRIQKATEDWKLENDVLMISDFNNKISDIVRKNPAPFIYEKIGERFNHILIDEFQDTSGMQWQNFLPLIENSLSKGHFNMVVGDAKQAIYRWRNGDVNQFIKLPEIHNPLSKEIGFIENVLKANYEGRELATNYRSSENIIDFNNKIYEEIKAIHSVQELYTKHDQNFHSKEKGQVIIQAVFDKKAEDRMEKTLELIQRNIEENIKQGYALSDQCILIRKKKHGSKIAKFITELGYDVVTSDSLLLKNNVSIQLIINWLKFIQNPNDEKAKVAFIRNYSLSFDPEKMSEWIEGSIERDKRQSKINLYNFLKKRHPKLVYDNLSSKTIYELVEWISREFKFTENTDQFLEKIHSMAYDFSEKKKKSLDQFIEYWEEQKERVSLDSSDGINGVKILTIHASKGLQFPVVIFPMIYSSHNHPKNIWLNDGDPKIALPGAVIKAYASKKTPVLPEIEIEFALEDMDEVNALYVATTRAENKMVLLIEADAPDSSSGMHSDLLGVIEKIYPDFDPEKEYRIGEDTKYSKTKKIEEAEILKSYSSKEVFEELRISLKSGRTWDSENTRAKDQAYGILIHEILSKIKNKEEIQAVLKEIKTREKLDQKLVEEIQVNLEKVFQKDKVASWFNLKTISKSEKALVDLDGHSYIPDKVVYLEDSIEIVDFKTGKSNKKHEKQVKKYMELLQKIEEKEVKGFLLYTSESSIVEVL